MANDEQRRELASALERAHREHVRVVTTGVRNDTGAMVWLVSSASLPGLLHIVGLVDDHHLACDCPAAFYGHHVCVHRAAVFEELAKIRAASKKPAMSPESEAILARNDKPFSLFKAE